MAEVGKEDWTTQDWVRKLKDQAEESREYRHKLYDRVNMKDKKKILDVGCGTGAVTMDIASNTEGEVIGIDIDEEKLIEAKKLQSYITNLRIMKGDVLDLPFEDGTFDLVVFNIVLMYIKDQQGAVNEMARVTQKGGHVLGTLECDYATKMDYPESPATPLILKTLEERGADLYIGRKLKVLFNKAGLKTEVGMDLETDFILMKDDRKFLDMYLRNFWVVEKLFEKAGWTKEQIEKHKQEEVERIEHGLSFHFMPMFYAIGRKV